MEKYDSNTSDAALREALGRLDSAVAAAPEVLRRWGWPLSDGNRRVQFYGSNKTESFWNHRIDGFYMRGDGTVSLMVYWQGDSTDGTEYVRLRDVVSDVKYGREYVIAAAWDHIGGAYGIVQRHGPVRVGLSEVQGAFRSLAAFISPEAVAERERLREEKRKREDLDKRAFKLVLEGKDLLYRHYIAWPEIHRNGRNAVREACDKYFNKLYPLDNEKLAEVIERVYSDNEAGDKEIDRDENGKKVYNLSGILL